VTAPRDDEWTGARLPDDHEAPRTATAVGAGGYIFIRPCNIAPIAPIWDPSGRDLGPQAPENPHNDSPQRMFISPTSENSLCETV
jgi:hypothetical protein